MIRNLIEKWSRGIVLKRRLPAQFGSHPIYVSPEAGLRYWKPYLSDIDPMLMQVAEQYVKPGNTVWDVGANLGFFTLTAAHKAGPQGKVLSFEPDIWLCSLLKKTFSANLGFHLDLMPVAVSNKIGMANFNIAVRSRSTNYLAESPGSTQTGGIRQTYAVPTLSLDSVLAYYAPPDFLKIDVEGAEHLVLEGATRLLREKKPIILCEVASTNFEYVKNLLEQHSYKLYDGQRLDHLHEFDINTSENILALPGNQVL